MHSLLLTLHLFYIRFFCTNFEGILFHHHKCGTLWRLYCIFFLLLIYAFEIIVFIYTFFANFYLQIVLYLLIYKYISFIIKDFVSLFNSFLRFFLFVFGVLRPKPLARLFSSRTLAGFLIVTIELEKSREKSPFLARQFQQEMLVIPYFWENTKLIRIGSFACVWFVDGWIDLIACSEIAWVLFFFILLKFFLDSIIIL